MPEPAQLSSAKSKGSRIVSVIIPTLNRAGLLVEAVESVLGQQVTGVELEILVIDDGSTDDTAERMVTFAGRVQYVRQPNAGVAAARNHGLRLATGELICFLDSDDLWLPAKLSRQIAFADAHPEVALIATEISPFRPQGSDLARSKAALYRIRNGMVVEDLLFSNWIQTSTVMVRRAAVLAAGAFDEDVGQFGEDWLLWMRIAAESSIHFLPEPLVCYRVHADSLTSHQPEAQFDSLMRILDRLAELQRFARRPELIARARYRVCLVRAWNDMKAAEFNRAAGKLQRARELRRVPVRAWIGLARVWIAQRLARGHA